MSRKNVWELKRGDKSIALIIALFFLLFYVYFQSSSIYGGDAGDLVSAAFVKGVPHPPGYPLYTFLGWMLTKLPHSTIAWRVGLISSIPASLSIGVFFLILRQLKLDRGISLITITTLGFSYLYWLYSVIPEVFTLNILFVVILFYFLLLYRERSDLKLLYVISFIFALSLTHHHTILFLLPAYVFLIWPNIRKIKITREIFFKLSLLFLLGLSPYIYVIWAAHGNPPVNWEDPKTINGFVRLVTRSIYGTFRSNQQSVTSLDENLRLLRISFETYVIDLTRVGVVLAVIGIVAMFRKNRQIFWPILSFFLLSGPFFILYTGFPSVLNFEIATLERFLLVPYIFFSIFIAFGIQHTSFFIDRKVKNLIKKDPFLSTAAVFCILPVVLLVTNLPKMQPLKNDRTAENLGNDILKTVPDQSLIFLSDDTTALDTQYVYLTSNQAIFKDLKLLQVGILTYPFYQNILSHQYHLFDLSGISSNDDTYKALDILVNRYYDKYPIFFATKHVFSNEYIFVQTGLLYRLYKVSDLPTLTVSKYHDINEELFSMYHDPLSGALRTYIHVMLDDVARVYSNARYEVGHNFRKFGDLTLAEKYFREALRLQPETPKNTISLTETLILQQKCDEAQALVSDYEKRFTSDPETYRLLALLNKDCFKDESKAQEFEKIYQDKVKEIQVDLDKF